jgi:hypothetical protein
MPPLPGLKTCGIQIKRSPNGINNSYTLLWTTCQLSVDNAAQLLPHQQPADDNCQRPAIIDTDSTRYGHQSNKLSTGSPIA